MTHLRYIFLSFLFILILPVFAQKKKTVKAKPAPTAVVDLSSVDEMMRSYRFDRAADLLEDAIEAAKGNVEKAEDLRRRLHRANLGADMLRGTARVTFIDSFLVGRDVFFKSLKLSADAGRIVAFDGESSRFVRLPENSGASAFINDFADRILFTASDSIGRPRRLLTAYKSKAGWGGIEPLKGMQEDFERQDFPFMMPDGVTLYFASECAESIGGYDLFITRYDAETKRYLKAENLGMPFSSPLNDYMLAIDEAAGTGYLVTDRGGDKERVCVYIFIHEDERETYDMDEIGEDDVIRAARIHSIVESQGDQKTVKAALERREAVLAKVTAATESGRYVISDRTVYKSLSEFRSSSARRIAEELTRTERELTAAEGRRELLQREAAEGKRSPEALRELENLNREIPTLRQKVRTLGKNMRIAETKK